MKTDPRINRPGEPGWRSGFRIGSYHLSNETIQLGGVAQMVERPGISRGETEILKALWTIGKGSVGEIHASIVENEKEMDYSTVQTYVRRLEAKGHLSAYRVGRNKIYRAAIRKSQVLGEAIDEFMERLFDGQLLPMVRHLVDSRDVTSQEIEDLMSLVKQLQEEQQDDAKP